MFRNFPNSFKGISFWFLMLLTTFIIIFTQPDATVGATFRNDVSGAHLFYFKNHSSVPIFYDFNEATGGDSQNEEKEVVQPGETKYEDLTVPAGTLEAGRVPFIEILGVPSPLFRFWSGDNGDLQYINALAGNGYEVTEDSSGRSEIVGNGFRITVDGGEHSRPSIHDITIQVYDD